MDYTQVVLFWLIAGLTGLSAIATLVSQNIVRSATWLLFTLGGTSGIFFLLGAEFVAATQLLIYVGGTMVLVVFGVMLTAQGPFLTMRTSAAEWAISIVVGVLLYAVLGVAALQSGRPYPEAALIQVNRKPAKERAAAERKLPDFVRHGPRHLLNEQAEPAERPARSAAADTIGMGFLGIGVGPAHREGGAPMRMSYLLPFEIVSVHLLVVLIGAAYLARAKRRRREATP